MKHRVIFTSLIAASISILSTAEPGPGQGPDHFKERKDHDIKMLSERKTIIESALGCIQKAQNPESLERCHKDEMDAHKKLQQAQLKERKKNLQDQLKKIEEQERNSDHTFSP